MWQRGQMWLSLDPSLVLQIVLIQANYFFPEYWEFLVFCLCTCPKCSLGGPELSSEDSFRSLSFFSNVLWGDDCHRDLWKKMAVRPQPSAFLCAVSSLGVLYSCLFLSSDASIRNNVMIAVILITILAGKSHFLLRKWLEWTPALAHNTPGFLCSNMKSG